jgi:hypothetical protein
MVVREAQQHSNWIDSLMRGVGGDGVRGMISALGNCVVSSAGGIAMLVRIETLTTLLRICAAYSGVRLLP